MRFVEGVAGGAEGGEANSPAVSPAPAWWLVRTSSMRGTTDTVKAAHRSRDAASARVGPPRQFRPRPGLRRVEAVHSWCVAAENSPAGTSISWEGCGAGEAGSGAGGSRELTPSCRGLAVSGGRPPMRWPLDLARLLGTMTDAELAERAGVHPSTVAAERRRRGLTACHPRRPAVAWTEEMLARLGCASDASIAAELELEVGSVRRKRVQLGIPAFAPATRESAFRWTPEALALLGTASDRDIARRLGVAHATVGAKRRELGVPRFGGHGDDCCREPAEAGARRARRWVFPGLRWRCDLRQLLELPTGELTRRFGVSRSTVRSWRRKAGVEPPRRDRRWTPELDARLGKDPDSQLAEELGVAPSTVRHRRLRLGIPACPRSLVWRDREVVLLGTAPDAEVARRLGCSRSAVFEERRRREIVASGRRRPTSELEPTAALRSGARKAGEGCGER